MKKLLLVLGIVLLFLISASSEEGDIANTSSGFVGEITIFPIGHDSIRYHACSVQPTNSVVQWEDCDTGAFRKWTGTYLFEASR